MSDGGHWDRGRSPGHRNEVYGLLDFPGNGGLIRDGKGSRKRQLLRVSEAGNLVIPLPERHDARIENAARKETHPDETQKPKDRLWERGRFGLRPLGQRIHRVECSATHLLLAGTPPGSNRRAVGGRERGLNVKKDELSRPIV